MYHGFCGAARLLTVFCVECCQVNDMCLYAEMAPKKLSLMGKYLLERIKDYLKVRFHLLILLRRVGC